jgi:hypothetical protein
MIWGMTPQQILAARDERRKRLARQWDEHVQFWGSPRPWFAWYPVKLNDGRRAWLEPLSVSGYVNHWGEWVWSYEPQKVVGAAGIEPATPAMSRQCSPAELRTHSGSLNLDGSENQKESQ